MVGDRTGLNAVVLSALECLRELGAQRGGSHVKSALVIDHAYATRGIPQRYGYNAICAISAPWLVHVRLIDFHGNLGSPDDNDEAAGARYTEVRLTRAGSMALAAERGELPRLPIGLINGDLAFGGTSPPFDPSRLADALRASAAGVVTNTELVEMAGLPAFPTSCSVDGDLTALASGAHTQLRLSAHVAIETDDRVSQLVISRLPFDVGPDITGQAIAARVAAVKRRDLGTSHPALHDQLEIPLRDVRYESDGDTVRLVCELLPNADPDICRDRILEIWPVTTEIPVQLSAPLPTLLRRLVDGSVAQQEAIAALLAP